jgi:hypothetical protein
MLPWFLARLQTNSNMDECKYTTVLGMGELSTAVHLTHQIHYTCQKMWKISWNNTTGRMIHEWVKSLVH